MDNSLARIGVMIPDVMIPRADVDLSRWAVVACDQYTAQPEYWAAVEDLVGDAPSTLRLIYPEVHLGEQDASSRISDINATMRGYVADGVFDTYEHTLILVRRETAAGVVRWGLMAALDLDHYSWNSADRSLIRATEGTILGRIPPRKQIRKDAPLELPHIMVLISDPGRTVIEPLATATADYQRIYDTDLMQHGGRVTGWAVPETSLPQVADALLALYEALDPADPLLFAMGDGNHSFATAKSCWEDIEPTLTPEQRLTHPARFALVEIENIFDPGLEFEPIHRVLFDTPRAVFDDEVARHCASFVVTPAESADDVMARVEAATEQMIGYCDSTGHATYTLIGPSGTIPAGTLQYVIDDLVSLGYEVDYIHGAETTSDIGSREGNLGIFLPPVPKDSFFATIVTDGALPRKTFSLGEADDKRYYLEARNIQKD